MRQPVGSLEVIALLDACGPFFQTQGAGFPAATPADWDLARRIDPSAFGPGGTWNLSFWCFAIRGPGDRIVLADAGVGPAGSPASAWAPVPGRLPDELLGAGIDPRDVDAVILTHLHADHVGWSVQPDGTPTFPNARYLIQQREIAPLAGADSALTYVVEPLRGAGQLHEVDGVFRLTNTSDRHGDSITLVPTPGHTPGHQSVVVEGSDGQQIVITGDVVVHAVQIADPDVGYLYEQDRDRASQTRRMLLEAAQRDHALLATAHLTQPFVGTWWLPCLPGSPKHPHIPRNGCRPCARRCGSSQPSPAEAARTAEQQGSFRAFPGSAREAEPGSACHAAKESPAPSRC